MSSSHAAADTRLRHIDTLRAVAAILVLWQHVGEVFVHLNGAVALGGSGLQEFASSINVGRIGVVAFFLISGFVIPFSIQPGQTAPVRTFLVKRFFRIYPAYWLSVPLGALTGYWIWGREFTAADFLVNLTLLQDLFGMRAAEGLYWTLLVELVFYALCVALLLTRSLGKPRRLLALAYAFSGVYVLAMLMRWFGLPSLGTSVAFGFLNLSIMLCGTLYRSLLDDSPAMDRADRAGARLLIASYLIILPAATVPMIGFSPNAQISYALGVLLFLAGTTWLRVQTRLTDWLGRISYSIYLFHPVVFLAMLWLLQRLPQDSWWRTRHLLVYLVANLLLTVAFATLVYRWVERPGMRLGRSLARAVQRRGEPGPVVATAPVP